MPMSDLITEISAVTAAGGSVTREYETLAQRWDEYVNDDQTAADRLAAAFINGEPVERIQELSVLALAALASKVDTATVRNTLDASLYPILKAEYGKTGAANYETLRAQFNDTAARFGEAIAIADPDQTAESLIKADAKVRTAWVESAVLAQELNTLLPSLAAAARLAGGARITSNDDHLALSVNPGTLHRRRVWEAWAATGRGGRWSALAQLGATIHAPALEDIKPYRTPAPMQIKQVHNGQGVTHVSFDPEDDEHTTAKARA